MSAGTKLRLARFLALTAVVLTLAQGLDSLWRVAAVVAGLHAVLTLSDLIARREARRARGPVVVHAPVTQEAANNLRRALNHAAAAARSARF